MHLTLDEIRYPLSNDYAPDIGQSWTWDRAVPACPECGEPLEADDRLIDARWRGDWTITCDYCGWQGVIES
jgi:predicted RNA-binding Zn-ribbon protein involved in translation (DUF1610 family)